MSYIPNHSWIVVEPIPRKESNNGIIIPIETGVEKVGHSIGRVISVPNPLYKHQNSKGIVKDPGFKAGDHILYRDYLKDIHEITTEDGKKLCFICWEDLIAVVDKSMRVHMGALVDE